MTKCSICESVFLGDIDKMISAGSNHKYVQQWCRERKFKVTLGAIENHQVDHLQQIEKTQGIFEGAARFDGRVFGGKIPTEKPT